MSPLFVIWHYACARSLRSPTCRQIEFRQRSFATGNHGAILISMFKESRIGRVFLHATSCEIHVLFWWLVMVTFSFSVTLQLGLGE